LKLGTFALNINPTSSEYRQAKKTKFEWLRMIQVTFIHLLHLKQPLIDLL